MRLFDRNASVATAVAVVLAVAGVVIALASNGVASVIGAGLAAIAAVLLIAVAFYVVGRSEDRHRLTHRHG